jgi:hypothetical protein
MMGHLRERAPVNAQEPWYADASPAPDRKSFTFSEQARYVACLRAGDPSARTGWGIESWRWNGAAYMPRLLTSCSETLATQLLPLDNDCVLVNRARLGGREIVLLTTHGQPGKHTGNERNGTHERLLVRYDRIGLRLVSNERGPGLAHVVMTDREGRSSLWELTDQPSGLRLVLGFEALGGTLHGGCRLDPHGRTLGFTLVRNGHPVPVSVTVDTGEVTSLFPGASTTAARLLLAAPDAGKVLLSVRAGAGPRIVVGTVGTTLGVMTTPPCASETTAMTPLALSPDGRSVAFLASQGVRSRLFVDSLTGSCGLAALRHTGRVLAPMARWVGDGLRVIGKRPTEPWTPTCVSTDGGRLVAPSRRRATPRTPSVSFSFPSWPLSGY